MKIRASHILVASKEEAENLLLDIKDGVAFEGGKGENYSLEIGSNTFIPGFEEQLIGMSAGDEGQLLALTTHFPIQSP